MYKKVGKLISKDIQHGTSKAGKAWSKIDFVIDLTTDPKWPNRVKFESFKGNVLEMVQDTTDGTNISVDFDVESRDWTNPQGKTMWFTSAKALNVEVVREESVVHQAGDHRGYNQANEMYGSNGRVNVSQSTEDDPSSDLPF